MSKNIQRVLFVTKSDLSGTAGHNIATRAIVAAFACSERISLTAVSPTPRGEFPTELEDAISNRVYLSKRPVDPTPIQRGFGVVDTFQTLRTAINTEQPDLIVARMNSVFLAPPVLADYYNIPYALLSRGTAYKSLRFSSILTRIYEYNVRTAAEVYVASNEIKRDTDRLRKPGQSESTFLPNAVDPDQFSSTDTAIARSTIGLPEDSGFVVGFVGSMKPYHRIDYLIRSLEYVDKPENITLLLVGDGPELDRYRQLAEDEGVSDQVVFTGFVPHSEVSTYISACDAVYGVSDQDSATPVKISEYLACARPVIARSIDELSFINTRDLGRLVTRDPEAIGTAIQELSDLDPAQRNAMGRRGRAYVKENRTWAAAVDRILNDFE